MPPRTRANAARNGSQGGSSSTSSAVPSSSTGKRRRSADAAPKEPKRKKAKRSDEDALYEIDAIVAEDDEKGYLFRWKGTNPKTGRPYPDSWEPKENAGPLVVETWETFQWHGGDISYDEAGREVYRRLLNVALTHTKRLHPDLSEARKLMDDEREAWIEDGKPLDCEKSLKASLRQKWRNAFAWSSTWSEETVSEILEARIQFVFVEQH